MSANYNINRSMLKICIGQIPVKMAKYSSYLLLTVVYFHDANVLNAGFRLRLDIVR